MLNDHDNAHAELDGDELVGAHDRVGFLLPAGLERTAAGLLRAELGRILRLDVVLLLRLRRDVDELDLALLQLVLAQLVYLRGNRTVRQDKKII